MTTLGVCGRWAQLRWGLALVLVASLLAACGDDSESQSGGALLRDLGEQAVLAEEQKAAAAVLDEPAEWTVFVYLAADNDLERFALLDLEEMAEASGVQIVALIDRNGGYSRDTAVGLDFFDDTRMIRIVDGEAEVVEVLGELDTGSRATLADFVADGINQFGSDRNGLVIWNHGASWPGAAVDETSGGTMLSLADIRHGVADGLARTDVDRLDLIGFDACLMATYEVAVNLAPVARTLLASEELEPGHGWNWSAVSAPDGKISTVELSNNVLAGFADQAKYYGTTGVTLSLVDLDALSGIDEAFAALSDAIDENAAGLVGRVAAERNRALGFGRDPEAAYDFHMVDLGHLAHNLTSVPGMDGPAADLLRALNDAVLLNITDHTTTQASGLAAYFPPISSLGRPQYEEVSGIDAWTGFLAAYYTGAEAVPVTDLPLFLIESRYLEDDQVVYGADRISLGADVTAGTGINMVGAKLYWGQVELEEGESVVFFGERAARVEGDTVSAEYDWRYLVVSDGRTEAPAYSQLDVGDNGTIRRIVIPVTYSRSRESVRASLVLGVENESVVSQTFYQYGTGGAIGEIEPVDGDIFVPRLLIQETAGGASEWVDASSEPLAADHASLGFHLRRLAPATPIMLEIGITDIDGGHDYVFHGTASP